MVTYRATLLLSLLTLVACARDPKTLSDCADGTWPDVDGDGHLPIGALDDCEDIPEILYAYADDCDDRDETVYPGAEEIPGDGVDQDCDGLDEPAADPTDSDRDGSPDDEDCDPYDDDAFPGAVESCDGADNDCDGSTDEDDAVDALTWYADADADGYGDPNTSTLACSAPPGFTEDDRDCDDTDPTVHPAADETADGRDEDCDGAIDEGTTESDDDGDGYSELGGDCDDTSSAIYPGAEEIPYNDADEDCSGEDLTDVDGDDHDAIAAGGDDPEDSDASIYPGSPAYDDDGDGYSEDEGDTDDADPGEVPTSDDDGDGYSPLGGDCDDADSGISPGVTEDCDDSLDSDCDGATDSEDADCPISIECTAPITVDTTWDHALYSIADDCILEVTGGATLTIEAGTTVLFGSDSGLLVGESGGGGGRLLIAGGAETVTLSSARPAPRAGDWYGLMLASDDLGSEISGLELEYAGADGDGGTEEWSGALAIVGTNAPIVTDSTISNGAAAGVYLDDASVTLSAVSVTGHELDGLRLTGGAEPEVRLSTFAENERYGIYIERGSGLAGSPAASGFTDNTMVGNGIFPIALPAASVPLLDLSNTFTESGDVTDADRIHVLGGAITRTGTWCAHDAPYYIQDNLLIGDPDYTPTLYIEGGAQLTFGTSEVFVGSEGTGALVVPAPAGYACSAAPPEGQVLFSGGSGWTGIFLGFYSSASTMEDFRVEGATGEGIYLYASTPRLSNFEVDGTLGTGLRIIGSTGSEMAVLEDFTVTGSSGHGVTISNTSTLISNCSVSANVGDGISIASAGGYGMAAPSIEGCTIEGNGGVGLSVAEELGCCIDLDILSDNTISGNGDVPARVPPHIVEKLADNIIDALGGESYIEVEGGYLDEDTTWYDLEIPYHVTGDIVAGAVGRTMEWTVEAGTEILVDRGVSVKVGYSTPATLDAAGTEDAPVVFDAFGASWAGLWLYDSAAHLDWTTVTSAGDSTYTESCGVAAAICCTSCSLTMTDSVVVSDEGYGLYCTGTSSVSYDTDSSVLGDGTLEDTYGCD